MIRFLRNNIGTITAAVGMVLLVILTYGDIGELFTEQYWINVGGNFTAIGALSIGLSLTQWSIKQGVSEQSLQAGLNRVVYNEDGTMDDNCSPAKYAEHREIIKRNRERDIYLSFFLTSHNKRKTENRKREFLVENEFSSEKALLEYQPKWYEFKNKRLKRKYLKIKTNITCDSLRWATTDITYDKAGRIQKLDNYRKKRAISSLLFSTLSMIGVAFIAGGLFMEGAPIPWWQKTVKLISYVIVMAITVSLSIIKNYEKGAFGVPNELTEVNNIWLEFENWIPSDDVERQVKILKGEIDEEQEVKDTQDFRTDIQIESEQSEVVEEIVSSDDVPVIDGQLTFLNLDTGKLSGEYIRDIKSA